MKFHRFLRHVPMIALLFSLMIGAGSLVIAHEAPCPHCSLDLVQDTATQDNETVLKAGRKRIEYRCVYCALKEANSEYNGDLQIFAPSEKKGARVVLTRKNGEWTSVPGNAVFVAKKANHRVCHITYRAFTSKAGFDAWVKKHKELDENVKPLTLAEMIAATK